jgi:hypothetical protein
MLRIIYELTHVARSGEDVGRDWTFYVHTGAGLVCFSAGVDAGRRTRVLGVRTRAELELASGAAFERELWWASVKGPEQGTSLFTPVWLPLEPGLEVHRSLELDVARLGGRTHLRLDLRARIERVGDTPAPTLDVTPMRPNAAVPRPEQTAGELPERFVAALEGVEVDKLPVVGERVLLLGRNHIDGDPGADALSYFLTHFAGGFLPAWYEPRAALYELRNPDDQPFWIGHNSTMGQRNDRRVIEAFAQLAPPLGTPIFDELGGFEERSSLLVELLGDAHTAELEPSAKALAQLIAALTSQHPERATVEREVYVRTALIDEHTGEWTRAFIVDPSPFSGPDESAWLVVWTDAWTE